MTIVKRPLDGVTPVRSPNLLIVEDDPMQQKLYKALCERFGFQCEVVGSCKEILSILTRDGIGYDICLLDWSLDGESGLDCIRKIRAITGDKHRRRLPIVVVTAHAMVGDREICLDAGCDDYLSKPFNLDQFHSTVMKWVQSSRSGFDMEEIWAEAQRYKNETAGQQSQQSNP